MEANFKHLNLFVASDPPTPGGSLGYCTCAQEATCTERRKKLGSSAA